MRAEAKAWGGGQHDFSEKGMRSRTYTNSSVDVLSEQDALELNDEEVDQLLQVTSHAVQSLARDGVVLLWPHLGSHALAERHPTGNLGGGSDTEHDPRQAKAVADDRKVAESEDGEDDSSLGQTLGSATHGDWSYSAEDEMADADWEPSEEDPIDLA